MLRRRNGPLLTRHDIPDVPPGLVDATSVFNPGACRLETGQPLLLLRVQTRGRRTLFMRAFGNPDGGYTVEPQIVEISGLERLGESARIEPHAAGVSGLDTLGKTARIEPHAAKAGDRGRPGCVIHHIYDPRITRLDGRWFVTCAIDTDSGCRVGIFTTDDFSRLELLSVTGDADVRNGVLFPERIGGRYLLLERPNTMQSAGGVTSGDAIELLSSDDLVHWRSEGPVFSGRRHFWDELIGPGPPPVKTADGWLLLYHGIATHLNACIYQAGAVLLKLDDPSVVPGRTRDNILEPRELYEMVGQVPNVVFPSGLICDPPRTDGTLAPDSTVQVIYGAADTCVGSAAATVRELIAACNCEV